MTIEQPTAAAAKRFESLDALRGICALLVATYHISANGFLATNALVRNAYLFVDYFFVLSGFVIAFSYGDRLLSHDISLSRFIGLRLGRIYPLHLAILAMFLVMELALLLPLAPITSLVNRQPFAGAHSLPALVASLLLLHAFGVTGGLVWNTPSWSIAAEVWCYALFGAMLVAAPKRPALIAAGLSFIALAWLVAWRGSIEVASDFGFVRCVYGFGLGLVTYQLFRRRRPQTGTLVELGIVAAIVVFVSLARGPWTFAAPPLFAVSIYLLAAGEGLISTILRRPAFQFLGMVSYSIYMIHYFVEQRLIDVLRLAAPWLTARKAQGFVISTSPWIADSLTLAALGLVVAVSFFTHRTIERPGQRIVRERLAGTTPSRAAAAE